MRLILNIYLYHLPNLPDNSTEYVSPKTGFAGPLPAVLYKL